MKFLSLQEVQGPHHQLLSRDMAWAVSSVDRAAGGEKNPLRNGEREPW